MLGPDTIVGEGVHLAEFTRWGCGVVARSQRKRCSSVYVCFGLATRTIAISRGRGGGAGALAKTEANAGACWSSLMGIPYEERERGGERQTDDRQPCLGFATET